MGDRVVVTFVDNAGDYSPGVYMHWAGNEGAAEYLRECVGQLRWGDVSYSAARYCGHCATRLPGKTGLGLLSPPIKQADGSIDWEDYSHGNGGVLVVNVDTKEVVNHDGDLAPFALTEDARV